MGNSLKQTAAVSRMAAILYSFLPWSGRASWKNHVNFKTVAEDVGLGQYWRKSSKTPGITHLLNQTLRYHRDRFEDLIIAVVQNGIAYRSKEGDPISRSEIEALNAELLAVEFKFSELWDEQFLGSLGVDGGKRSKEALEVEKARRKIKESRQVGRAMKLDELNQMFFNLVGMENRQKAGKILEELLTGLFHLEGLEPREPFRVSNRGVEIDGSFELDHEIYLLEAKWVKGKMDHIPLDVFLKKIRDRSSITRGVLLAMDNFTQEALDTIRGPDRTFVIMDGADLAGILQGAITLSTLLRKKIRLLGDKGRIYVPGTELINDLS